MAGAGRHSNGYDYTLPVAVVVAVVVVVVSLCVVPRFAQTRDSLTSEAVFLGRLKQNHKGRLKQNHKGRLQMTVN